MYPFNQNFIRDIGSRQSQQQGFGNNSHVGRDMGRYRNDSWFSQQNNPRYGNDSNKYTDMYGNANQGRQGFQGEYNNFNCQRQLSDNQTQQNDRQYMRQSEYQRSGSYPCQFGHPYFQGTTASNQVNWLIDRQRRAFSGQSYCFEEERCSPEFNYPRGRPYPNEWELQRERHNSADHHQHFERQDFANDGVTREIMQPNLSHFKQKYYCSSSQNFNHDQSCGRNFTPYNDQTTLFQKHISPQRYRKKNKMIKMSYLNQRYVPENVQRSNMMHYSSNQKTQVHSKLENCSDHSTEHDNKETEKSSTLDQDNIKDFTTTLVNTASEKLLPNDQSLQKSSQEMKSKLSCLEMEGDNKSSSSHMVCDKEEIGPTNVNQKVFCKTPVCNVQTEYSPSSNENQECKIQSPSTEQVGGITGRTTKTDQSAVENVQHCMELVSLDGETCMLQDNERNTGSPQQSKDAQCLLIRPSVAEKNKPLSPAMKDRKQFFGVPLQKRGKETPKPQGTGKTWSSSDYFTGSGESQDIQSGTVKVHTGNSSINTSVGSELVSEYSNADNKTCVGGNGDQDTIHKYSTSDIGDSLKGSKIRTPAAREGQEGKWRDGRHSDMSDSMEGNREICDRDAWQTPDKDSSRRERIARDDKQPLYCREQQVTSRGMETGKKYTENKMSFTQEQQSVDKGEKMTESVTCSQNTGLTYREKNQPGERRQYNSPNRFPRDHDKRRQYGSSQYNSPRSRQENYYSQNKCLDRDRTKQHRSSIEEFQIGSKQRIEGYRRSRDSESTVSPQGRNQDQFSYGSGRSYRGDQYSKIHNLNSSPCCDSSNFGKSGAKRGSLDSSCTLNNYPDQKCAQVDRSKSFDELKSSQNSESLQRIDQKVKPPMMEQDPDISTRNRNVKELYYKTIEQNTDVSRHQRSMHGYTTTEQKSDNAQKIQIVENPTKTDRVELEMKVSGCPSGNDEDCNDRSLEDAPKEQKENKSKFSSVCCATDTHDNTHSHNKSRSAMFEESSSAKITQSICTNISPQQFSSDVSEIKGNINKADEVFPSKNIQGNKECSSQSKLLIKSHTENKKQHNKMNSSQQLQKGFLSMKPKDKGQGCMLHNDKDTQSPMPTKPVEESLHSVCDQKGHNHKSALSVKPSNVYRMSSYSKEEYNQSPKRQYSSERESPRRGRHSSDSSQVRGSSRDHDKVKDRNRSTSGGSTHSSDTGRARSHSRESDSHYKDKRSHTSHKNDYRKVAGEKNNESNFDSDSGNHIQHIHRHQHRSKRDKSNSHRHRQRSKDDSSYHGERKEAGQQRSKDMDSSSILRSNEEHRDGGRSKARYSRMDSATGRWKDDDIYIGGSDVDIDEEDSDDELETPFFLTSLTEASSRPIPSTPTKGINSSKTESPTPSCRPQISLAPLSSFNSGFSLDVLLAEAIDKTSEERQCEDMHAVLEEGLRKGGFVKDTLEVSEEAVVDEDLLPEHELKLKEFQIYKSKMSEVHPGENIFLGNKYQCLFNADVSLQACGFVPGTTYIDKHLITVQPANYVTLLTSDIMLMCFDAISCQDAVLRWLLFIMSVHPSHLLINCCYKTIQEHLYSCQHFSCKAKHTWSPAVTDILSILCNYGADPNELLPKSLVPNTESLRKSLFQQNNEIPPAGKYNRENFRLVLSSLAMAFQIRPKYTDRQVTQMIVMLCKAALDKSLNNYMLTHEFEVVLASLMKLYTEADWTSQSLILCRELSTLTEHHHNKVYLAQLLPPTTKGNFLQRRVSFLMIHQLFYPDQKISDDVVLHFQLNRVHNVLPRLQGLADEDIYMLASSVSLLDLCIGNGLIKSAEKEDLEYITEQMKKLTGEVRDNVRMLDKTRIKDMMIRITSKWTLVLLSTGSKQRTLFECPGNFRKSLSEVKIETVDASQTDQASESEEEDTQSEEENPPSEGEKHKKIKTKIKTVTVDEKNGNMSASVGDERMEVDEDDDLPEL
ncbi:E3 ubiquitin-protein ligase RBBP6-like [Ylistrum balloti]|uniref:E3 ubiquitin-protein ligase RBBP6-like n=1 Tax=Ylistrum balloti TaxID=509963 RepID=UPI002905F5ED|nr:E3 ubiquitin-protein ligase RBBP6-like [Ylistrum balloti]